MKDMSIIANKKIVNKETDEVRLVVSIDEENRKIFSVPVNEPDTEPACMAAATYDRCWKLYDEPETEEVQPEAPTAVEEPETAATEEQPQGEPMKMGETITALERIFDKLNAIYFEGKLPRPRYHRSDHAESIRPLLYQEDLEERE